MNKPELYFKNFKYCKNETKKFNSITISLKSETLKTSELDELGKYPVVNSGLDLYGKYNKYNNLGDAFTIASRGEYVGNIHYFKDKFWAGGLCYPYRCINSYNTKLLSFYMDYNFYTIRQLFMNTTGIPAINKKDLETFKVTLPSNLEEQQKISTFLSAFDLKIEHESQIIEQLKQLKKSLLYKMFPTENSNVPELRFKGFTDVWEQRELKELGKILTGSTPSTSNPNYYSKIGIPWVTPTDIKSVTISETPRKLSKEGENIGRIVPANTILCTCIASIGKNTLLTVKGSFNQQINSLTPNKENNAYFLLTESNFWSDKMKKITTSGMMQIINKSEFSNLQTMIPILKEQKQIGELFSKIDSLITLHQRKYNYFLSIIVNIYQINN